MGFEEKLRDKFLKLASTRFANKRQMCVETGIDYNSLSSFLKGKGLNVAIAARAIDLLGAELVWPDAQEQGEMQALPQTRDIEIINAKVMSNAKDTPPPASEDYLAVPLAAEAVAAGTGMIASEDVRGWVIVWRHHDSIRFRTNLVAVEIGKGQTSMTPTLHPGDIVLVDRGERSPANGKIMLVCEPGQEGGCAIKRVSSRRVDGDTELVFYSDNSAEYAPSVYRLKRDYDDNLAAAIGGRVVWAWSDMTRK